VQPVSDQAPLRALLDREAYLDRWSGLHGGVAPRGLIGGWLRVIYLLARPLAQLRVPPWALTLAALLVAALVLPLTALGGRWPLFAVLAVVASGLLDGLDGAVAVLTDRVSGAGAVLDSTCDRLAELCFVGGLWLSGAPAACCLAGGTLALLHEQVRACAAASGMDGVGVVTVSERPTRVIVTAAFLLGVGLRPAWIPASPSAWATAGAVAWTALGTIGLLQLIIVVHRRLS
jgi:CDP-diacylglycerol--glycerol-3-phosphate 3-phosphatidyltransferase